MLFIRLGSRLFNLCNVLEIYSGKEDEYIEVIYGNESNTHHIQIEDVNGGVPKRLMDSILGVTDADERMFFVKLGPYLVNLARVNEIQVKKKMIEIYYDTSEITSIDKNDIEPGALEKLNDYVVKA